VDNPAAQLIPSILLDPQFQQPVIQQYPGPLGNILHQGGITYGNRFSLFISAAFRFSLQENRVPLGKENPFRWQFSDSYLGAAQVLKNPDVSAGLLPQFQNRSNQPFIGLQRTVGKVDPGYVHPRFYKRFQDGGGGRGWTDCTDDLGFSAHLQDFAIIAKKTLYGKATGIFLLEGMFSRPPRNCYL
jgi:hypothetical protein